MTENLHEGHRKKVRERYLSEGSDSFNEHQLLELLLYGTIPRKDTNEIAHRMLNAYGSLPALCDADPKDICNTCKVGENTAISVSLVSSIAKRYTKLKWDEKTLLNSPGNAGAYARTLFVDKQYECFYLICVNSQNRLNHPALVQNGTLNEVPVYTRLIVELALRHKAHSVILAHNHPGGSLTPSQEDINITNTVISALDTININVNDHIIVAGNKYISLKEQNYF